MGKSRVKPQPEYELKHRITGAAIMIALAVVVIPLLLKDPAIEASVDSAAKTAEVEQKAFKSKIEPLNLNNINIKKKEDDPGDNSGDDLKPALLNADEVVAHNPEKDEKQEAAEKPKEEKKPEEQVVMTEQPEEAEPETVQTAETISEEPEVQEESKPEVPRESQSGWAVRVGTFAKKENVDSISQILNKSGFNARHTEVETTLGKATRVWLGPYADKDTADKVSLRLKTLTGEKGYVTKHAS